MNPPPAPQQAVMSKQSRLIIKYLIITIIADQLQDIHFNPYIPPFKLVEKYKTKILIRLYLYLIIR